MCGHHTRGSNFFAASLHSYFKERFLLRAQGLSIHHRGACVGGCSPRTFTPKGYFSRLAFPGLGYPDVVYQCFVRSSQCLCGELRPVVLFIVHAVVICPGLCIQQGACRFHRSSIPLLMCHLWDFMCGKLMCQQVDCGYLGSSVYASPRTRLPP